MRPGEWTPQEDSFIAAQYLFQGDNELAIALRRTEFSVAMRRQELGLSRNVKRLKVELTERQPDDPTPEEIKAACALIRKSWNPHERRARNAYGRRRPVETISFAGDVRMNGMTIYKPET